MVSNTFLSVIGSTAAGIYALERNGLRAAVMEALEAATNKSKEISQSSTK